MYLLLSSFCIKIGAEAGRFFQVAVSEVVRMAASDDIEDTASGALLRQSIRAFSARGQLLKNRLKL